MDTFHDYLPSFQDDVQVLQELTRWLFEELKLKYDIQFAGSNYMKVTNEERIYRFKLQKFVDRILNGHYGKTETYCVGTDEEYFEDLIVNCFDCALALHTFGNLLGCPTELIKQYPFGFLRYIQPIGRGKCNNPVYKCGGRSRAVRPFSDTSGETRKRFSNHCYVRLGSKVFDSTMREWVEPPRFLGRVLGVVASGRRSSRVLEWLFPSYPKPKGWLTNMDRQEYETRVIQPTQTKTGDPEVLKTGFTEDLS